MSQIFNKTSSLFLWRLILLDENVFKICISYSLKNVFSFPWLKTKINFLGIYFVTKYFFHLHSLTQYFK